MPDTTPAPQPKSAREHAQDLSHRGRGIALAVVALAFVMDLLDSTIVNIAIPSIQANLGTSYTTIQWLIAGYALAFAVLLITGGRMGDVFGYKKLFLIGVGGFTLASLLSGLAWNAEVLVGARLLQGAMAALMAPQVMSLMQVMYKPEERATANGLFGALGGLAASLGPIIGGLLIKANIWGLDWRPIFLINIPVGIFALIGGMRFLPDGKSAHPLKLDLTGTGLIVLALSLLIFPLIQGREQGWPQWMFYMMAAAVPVLLIFAWWQRRKDRLDGSPLVMPALFRRRSFTLGVITNLVFSGAMVGFFLTFTLLLQAGLGYSVIHAALTGIATAIGIGFTIGVLSGKLIPRLGRYTVTLGTVVMGSGLIATAWIAQRGGIEVSGWAFAPALLFVGLGMGMIMMPLFAIALNDVDHNHAGSASGTLNAVQQVGGAAGIALVGLIFFGALTSHAGSSFDAAAPQLRADLTAAHIPTAAQDQIVQGVKTCFADRVNQKDSTATPPSCRQTSQSAPGASAISQAIQSGAKTANANNFLKAFQAAVYYELTILGVIFILSFFLPRKVRPEALEAAA